MKDRKIADAFACVLRDSPVWLRLWSPQDLCVSNFLSSSGRVALLFYTSIAYPCVSASSANSFFICVACGQPFLAFALHRACVGDRTNLDGASLHGRVLRHQLRS